MQEVEDFFGDLEKVLVKLKKTKMEEVHDIFVKLKFEDLKDMTLYYDLYNTISNAVRAVKQEFS